MVKIWQISETGYAGFLKHGREIGPCAQVQATKVFGLGVCSIFSLGRSLSVLFFLGMM
jgi:hypothetical protein